MNKKEVKSILKTETKVIAYIIICLTTIVIGISFSLYSSVQSNKNNQVVKAGTLTFDYSHGTEITNSTKEACFNQMTLDEAKTHTECEYSVEITNTGSLPAAYNLTLTTATGNTLDLNKLKIIVKKNDKEEANNPKSFNGTNYTLATNEKIAANNGKVKYSVIVYVDDETADEKDDGETIALQLQGSAEVNGENINY